MSISHHGISDYRDRWWSKQLGKIMMEEDGELKALPVTGRGEYYLSPFFMSSYPISVTEVSPKLRPLKNHDDIITMYTEVSHS